MYNGTHSKKTGKRRLAPWAALALALVLVLSAGSTIAWIYTNSPKVENTFIPATSGIDIQEDFDGETKENVNVLNTGDYDIYVRVALVPVWEDADGKPVGEAASLANDFTITGAFPGTGWEKGSDGFYYYTSKVSSGETTKDLITTATVKADAVGLTKGYVMNLQVFAQSIQAEPDDAVRESWTSGVSAVAEDGTLTIIK